jgi:curved DNA-binding protein
MSQTFDSNIDYYKVLGLTEKATPDELKQAHIELALKYHPDTASSADQADRADRFIAVTDAWKVLSNPAVRANYDAVRQRLTSHSVGSSPRSSFVGASRYDRLGKKYHKAHYFMLIDENIHCHIYLYYRNVSNFLKLITYMIT